MSALFEQLCLTLHQFNLIAQHNNSACLITCVYACHLQCCFIKGESITSARGIQKNNEGERRKRKNKTRKREITVRFFCILQIKNPFHSGNW